MALSTKCPITGSEATEDRNGGDYRRIKCSALGGIYKITGTAEEMCQRLHSRQKAKLATWVLNQRRLGTRTPGVTSSIIEQVVALASLTVLDRYHRLLRFLQSRTAHLGRGLPWGTMLYMDDAHNALIEAMRAGARAWTESVSDEELDALVQYGISQNVLSLSSQNVYLTFDGWRLLEQLELREGQSDQGFVAMWFGAEVAGAFEDGIAPAIIDSGYRPMRIDQKEHANRIDDEIIAEIRRSRFVVADFTCGVVDDGGKSVAIPRGGVYYEAGFAQGLGIPVIWMCREDHINHVHFDTRQFNHITWTDAVDLREKLKNRIGAVLGDGPNVGGASD